MNAEHIGISLIHLAADQAEWSQRVFGSDEERGPIGALRHLEKEAKEAIEEYEEGGNVALGMVEIADCFLLILDAARRACISPEALISLAAFKMEANKKRKWPTSIPNQPTEHIKE